MRPKRYPIFSQFPQIRQRHHLESAGIRQDRPTPVHEFMQSSQGLNSLGSVPEHQMISVPQQDLRTSCRHALRHHRFDGRSCPHRHERRGLNNTPICMDFSAPRLAVARSDVKSEARHIRPFLKSNGHLPHWFRPHHKKFGNTNKSRINCAPQRDCAATSPKDCQPPSGPDAFETLYVWSGIPETVLSLHEHRVRSAA